MLFNEIYGVYYNTVSKIISKSINTGSTINEIEKIVKSYAFDESLLTIPKYIKEQRWLLLDSDYHTPIKSNPTRALTLLEKRWLKSIFLDKRMKLFVDKEPKFLENVKPLFTPDDYFIFDKYNDGDNYDDFEYIKNFRIILSAIKDNKPIKISFLNRTNKIVQAVVIPLKLEYSEKDDKFRLITTGCKYVTIVNLARIKSCEVLENRIVKEKYFPKNNQNHILVDLVDERNALERFMLHFSHFAKEAEKLSDNSYRIKIYYDNSDNTEMIIRILSFGAFVKVIEPTEFVNLIKERLKMQKACELK